MFILSGIINSRGARVKKDDSHWFVQRISLRALNSKTEKQSDNCKSSNYPTYDFI